MTGILPIPGSIEQKVEIINIKNRWKFLSEGKKKEILKFFNISLKKIEFLKKEEKKILLLTQPLSEDGILIEKEKIQIYEEIIINRNLDKIYIKPHPRERTNYKNIFKNRNFEVEIIDNNFPIELLLFSDIFFDKIITLFSTAALNFKNYSNVEFLGTKNYPKLFKKFGCI